MDRYDYGWLSLTINGFVDSSMATYVANMEYVAQDNNMRKMEYSILGYSKDFLIYKNIWEITRKENSLKKRRSNSFGRIQ